MHFEAEPTEVPAAQGSLMPVELQKASQRRSGQSRALRLARYEEVVRCHRAGESILTIGQTLNLDRRTVRGFVRAVAFPERAPRAAVPTLLDAHQQYLTARAAEGCRNAMQVWRELRARGFTGGHSIVRDAFAQLRGAPPDGNRLPAAAAAIRPMAVPSTRRACAWLLGWQQCKVDKTERSNQKRFVETLCRIEPVVAQARSLAHRFLGFVHRRDVNGFDRWLSEARACAVVDLRRFAAGLEADLCAVRAAFSSPWSSGQVKGQINQLKYLKRQTYGRAKLDLLRIRVLHPN